MAISTGQPVEAETSSRHLTPYKTMATNGATQILDIRTGATEFDILQDIKKGLRPENGGEKKLPTLLLYDEAGLRLFEKITYLDEYYLTNAEIEVRVTSTLAIFLSDVSYSYPVLSCYQSVQGSTTC